MKVPIPTSKKVLKHMYLLLPDCWELAQHTLTYIVLNKRRGSECFKLRLKTYIELPLDWNAIMPREVLYTMSPEEQKMFDKFIQRHHTQVWSNYP